MHWIQALIYFWPPKIELLLGPEFDDSHTTRGAGSNHSTPRGQFSSWLANVWTGSGRWLEEVCVSEPLMLSIDTLTTQNIQNQTHPDTEEQASKVKSSSKVGASRVTYCIAMLSLLVIVICYSLCIYSSCHNIFLFYLIIVGKETTVVYESCDKYTVIDLIWNWDNVVSYTGKGRVI